MDQSGFLGKFCFEERRRGERESERESGGPTLNWNGSVKAYETKEYDHSDSDSDKQEGSPDDESQTRLVLPAFVPLTFATFFARGSRTPPHQPPSPTLQALLIPILPNPHPCHFPSPLPALFHGRRRCYVLLEDFRQGGYETETVC